MVEKLGDSSMSLEDAANEAIRVMSRKFDADHQPDLSGLKTCELKKGKYAFKIAKYWTIRSRKSGKVKHNQLTLQTLRCTQKRGWEWEEEHTITLSDEGEDEIGKLFSFLAGLPRIDAEGEHVVISTRSVDGKRFERVLEAIASSDKKISLIEQILAWIDSDPRVMGGLIRLASDDPERTKSLVAALNYGRYSRAIRELQDLVEGDHRESKYQSFLQEHDWMFGSEYGELLPNRILARGIEVDFPLRRTVDGYLEVVEIKTPLNGLPLFIGDKHLYARTELTQAISQARDYLALLDENKYMIKSEDGLVVDKVRAKVVIGRTGNEEQQLALRKENAHQDRVETITFDQLIAIGQRILSIMTAKNPYLQELDLVNLVGSEQTSDVDKPKDLPF